MKPKRYLVLLVFCTLFISGCIGERFGISSGFAGPVVSEKLVFVGSRDGIVRVFDKHTGSQMAYSFPRGDKDPLSGIYGTPFLSDELLLVGDYDGKLYGLRAFDLSLLWEYPSDQSRVGHIVAGPTVAGGLILFSSSDGYVRALQREKGALEWEFQTGNMVWSTPTVDGDTVYVTSMDHKLYALFLKDGSPKWPAPFESNGAIVSSTLVANGKVFFGSFDKWLYAVDMHSGKKVWSFQGDAWFWGSPVTDGKFVYALAIDGKLFALDIETGLKKWEFDLENPSISTPVLLGGRIAVTSDNGFLHILSANDGKPEGKYNLGSKVMSPLAHGDEIVYVNTMDTGVWAIRVVGGQEKVWNSIANENS
jgi:outer membrane protein assembly factor BamB